MLAALCLCAAAGCTAMAKARSKGMLEAGLRLPRSALADPSPIRLSLGNCHSHGVIAVQKAHIEFNSDGSEQRWSRGENRLLNTSALLSEASGNEGVQVRCLPGSAHHADVHFCGRAREHAASHCKRESSVFMLASRWVLKRRLSHTTASIRRLSARRAEAANR